MTPKQVVERYLAEVLTSEGPGRADELISSEELRQRAGHFRIAFPDLGRGTHHGVFQGIPPTGRPWEARCTAIYRIEDDRIADGWVTWDHLSLLHQLGAVERVSTVSA
jgi:SnoaL-like polyketide cyclase